MTNVILQELIDTLKRSSKFSSGDAGCFKIKFDKDLELPGKDSASDYLKALNIKSLGKTLVLFAGSGGLCVELAKLATSVTAYEPRLQYEVALKEVCNIDQLTNGISFNIETSWPTEQYDSVIWPEGLDTLKSPITSLVSIYELLTEGGTIYIEVVHGEQLFSLGNNSWKPTEKVFSDFITKQFPDATIAIQKGRLQRRLIYKITKPMSVIKQEIKQEVKLPEIYLEIASKTVDFDVSSVEKTDWTKIAEPESKIEEVKKEEVGLDNASDVLTDEAKQEIEHKAKKKGKKTNG